MATVRPSKTPAKRAATSSKANAGQPSQEDFWAMLAGMSSDIVSAIVAGSFDQDLLKLDDALGKRTDKLVAEKAAAVKKVAVRAPRKETPAAPVAKETKVAPVKRTPAPPKTASVKPVAGTTYQLVEQLAKVGGKKVKYLRDYKEKGKVVVQMLEDAAGNPKGKSIVVPLPALTAVAATPTRRRTVKK